VSSEVQGSTTMQILSWLLRGVVFMLLVWLLKWFWVDGVIISAKMRLSLLLKKVFGRSFVLFVLIVILTHFLALFINEF